MVSIDRPCPAHAKASACAQALSTMYQAARPHGENGYAAYGASGVFYLLHEIEDTSTKSKVWKYFGFPVDENGAVTNKKQVVCRICNRSLAYSGNTINLFHHLQANHPEQCSEVAPNKAIENCESTRQATISGCFSAQQAYALVEFMCKDLQPISVVDSPAFLKLLSTLDIRYIPASRSTFSRVIIPAKYISVKEIVLASLSTASHCSLTTDLWTGCHKRAYTSVTAHYITSEWEMKHNCLQTREVDERHTAENLGVELQAALKEWGGLEYKAYGCTTDNVSNTTNAVVDHLQLVQLPCIGHTLQLSVEWGLQATSIA